MATLITEFLEQYSLTFHTNLTLKFHNLLHYPRLIKMLRPLYNLRVMHCERQRDFKNTALSIGNFKNIYNTIAVRHQMN